jgi:hypothetical protein
MLHAGLKCIREWVDAVKMEPTCFNNSHRVRLGGHHGEFSFFECEFASLNPQVERKSALFRLQAEHDAFSVLITRLGPRHGTSAAPMPMAV